jgi:hypothetical protein
LTCLYELAEKCLQYCLCTCNQPSTTLRTWLHACSNAAACVH